MHAFRTVAALAAGLTAAGATAAADTLFVSCDNGLRCVKAPCPARDVVSLPSAKRYAGTEPDLSRLPEQDRQRKDLSDGLYGGTLVFAGTIDTGPPIGIVARRIVRSATAAESALCRARRKRESTISPRRF